MKYTRIKTALKKLKRRGLKVSRMSYIRWLLFHSFMFYKDGSPKYNSFKSAVKRELLQDLHSILPAFALGFLLYWYTETDLPQITPTLDSLEKIEGVIVGTTKARWTRVVKIKTKKGIVSINEPAIGLFKEHINKEAIIYYNNRKNKGKTIWHAVTKKGYIIIDYQNTAQETKNRFNSKSEPLAAAGYVFLVFLSIPLFLFVLEVIGNNTKHQIPKS